MQSAKLTNDMRFELMMLLRDHRFEGERAEVKQMLDKVQGKLYAALFTPAQRKQMATLPDGWMPEVSDIKMKMGHDRFTFRISPPVRAPSDQIDRYAPATMKAKLPAEHPLVAEFAAWRAADEELRKREMAAGDEAKVILSAHTTTKQLIEAWPEIEPFVARLVTGRPLGVPEKSIAQINDEFRLTRKKRNQGGASAY